jgi:hypothetical protein
VPFENFGRDIPPENVLSMRPQTVLPRVNARALRNYASKSVTWSVVWNEERKLSEVG